MWSAYFFKTALSQKTLLIQNIKPNFFKRKNIQIICLFTSLTSLLVLTAPLKANSSERQPYTDIWNCLYTKLGWNVPPGQWRFNVQHSGDGKAFYIGDNNNHYTVLNYDDGYHHTMGDWSSGQIYVYDIAGLSIDCNADKYCTDDILDALDYLDRCPAPEQPCKPSDPGCIEP